MNAKKIDKCRITGSELTPVFDLGNPCVSDFVKPGEESPRAPLCVAIANDWPYLPQLTHSYPQGAMYGRYHYRSGTNEAMKKELADVVDKARKLRPVTDRDFVLDIACNDLTLLKAWWSENVPTDTWPHRIGIDPSDVAKIASEKGGFYSYFANDYFSTEAYHRLTDEKAAVITCIAMFYDLDDPIAFLKDVRACLRDDGLFVLQVALCPMMLDCNGFDAICHEHLCYYTCDQLAWILKDAGMIAIDAEITSSNGGSIRLYAMPDEAAKRHSQTIEGIAGAERILCVQVRERAKMLTHSLTDGVREWNRFGQRIENNRAGIVDFLCEAKRGGKTVIGYGASTKGNTLLQHFGIAPDILPCIADRQEQKVGLVCAGSNIPIISEETMRAMKPDYLFALPWHFTQHFQAREKALLTGGTKFVTALPHLTIHE